MSAKRLDDLRAVDPVLTTIAQNWSNDLYFSSELFPTITVSKSEGKFPVFGKESFFLRNTARAIRAASNRVPSSEYELETFSTQEHDIEMALDILEVSEALNFSKYEQRIAKELRDSLALNREQEITSYLQNSDNFTSARKTVLTAGNHFDDPSPAVAPFQVLRNAENAMKSNIGRLPNLMVANRATIEVLMKTGEFLSYCTEHNLLFPTFDDLAKYIGIGKIIISGGIYTENGETFSELWGDNILFQYINRPKGTAANEYVPNFGYIFELSGMPEIDTYHENGGKVKIIRCTDNFCWKVTAPDAGYLIADTLK